ncbi:MAG: hypothetical protein ACK559_35690, partial [bacterium]
MAGPVRGAALPHASGRAALRRADGRVAGVAGGPRGGPTVGATGAAPPAGAPAVAPVDLRGLAPQPLLREGRRLVARSGAAALRALRPRVRDRRVDRGLRRGGPPAAPAGPLGG